MDLSSTFPVPKKNPEQFKEFKEFQKPFDNKKLEI